MLVAKRDVGCLLQVTRRFIARKKPADTHREEEISVMVGFTVTARHNPSHGDLGAEKVVLLCPMNAASRFTLERLQNGA
jgi:hypothetical protein